jgi:hypothetical protein
MSKCGSALKIQIKGGGGGGLVKLSILAGETSNYNKLFCVEMNLSTHQGIKSNSD